MTTEKINVRELVDELRQASRWIGDDSLDAAAGRAIDAVADAIVQATPALRAERDAEAAERDRRWREEIAARQANKKGGQR